MSKLGVLLFRKIFESGDAKRIASQKQDISDLEIRKDTLKLAKRLKDNGDIFILKDYPKGQTHKLGHVFSVTYPMYEESREVFREMSGFFEPHNGY